MHDNTIAAAPLTAAVTLLALALYLVLSLVAGRARGRSGIRAPAVTGDENFERAYRVQMNTIEQLVFFLPALWLCAALLSDAAAAAAGLVWVVARVLYARAYLADPASRGPWFGLTVLAAMALFLGALAGFARTLFL